jgi:hypothetical protein
MNTLFAALRPLRAELVGVAGLIALLLLAAGVVAARLLAFDLPAICLDLSTVDVACQGRQFDVVEYQTFASNWTSSVAVGAALLPALAGVILGLSTVAKELDQRTAVLAWSVGPSRRRWMLQRAVPLGVVVFVLGIGCAQLIAALAQLRSPGAFGVPEQEFETLASSGFGPAASGISAFGVTVVVGAMLGRLLPSLLAAGAFVLFASLLIQQGNEQIMVGESLIAEQQLAGPGRQVDSLLRTPDGRIISWNDAFPDYADPNTGELLAGVTQMVRYVPIEIYPQVAAQYVVFHLLVGFGALTLAFAVVERRSP